VLLVTLICVIGNVCVVDSGNADCVLAMGFEKMDRGSLGMKVIVDFYVASIYSEIRLLLKIRVRLADCYASFFEHFY